MGNKRLKKRAYSLKGLGRRGLSMLMAMVMTLSLVQISAFATDGEENDTLKPKAVADKNGHNITLSKTAERVGDTEWKVTVKADIGETPIKQQPLDVVFVLDRSGSMAWCTEEPHEHSDSCYQLKADADPEHEHSWWREYDILGNFYPSSCPNYELACGHYYEEEHEHSGNTTCYYKETKDSEWTAYPSRLSAAKSAMNTLEGNLPNGANVQYVSFSSKAKQETSLDDVKAKGGTNIMAGVDKGIDLLNQNQSTVTKKVLVLLSDGEDDNGNYSSDKLKNFNGDVYTVGFAVDNQNLKGMIKGDGKYLYAENAEALDSAFTELSTRISAMIVDPMGDGVTYVSGSAKDGPKENENFETVKGNITLDSDGRTLRWTPTNKDSFNNTVIQYTYRVKLNPSKNAGNYTGIKLNNPTYLQYGIEQNGNKTAYTGQFNIPEGFYQVSTLEEKFVALNDDGTESEITDSKQRPNDFQSEVTDYITEEEPTTELKVYAPIQALDTNDEHVKYVYQYSKMIDTLDGTEVSNDIINVKDENNAFTTKYEAPYDQNVVDVTNKHDAYELIHYYKQYTVNSVEYKYAGDIPEDATELTDGYAKTWYPTGTTGIEVQPDAESEKYNFSGWEKISGEAKVETETRNEIDYAVPGSTFTLTAPEGNVPAGDVVFQGKWTLKPSYRVVADYYIITDDGAREKQNGDTPQPIYGVKYEINNDPVSYTAGSSTYGSKEYTEVELSRNQEQLDGLSWDADTSTVGNIIPTEGTTVVHLDYIRREKSNADYTVTHEYYNVVSGGDAQPTGDNYTTDVITAKHGDKISVTDAMKDSTANGKHAQGYYEYVSDNGPISLDKAETKNLTIKYNHYQYVVTTQGDDGVATRSGDGIYDKNGTAQVKFTLNEGYQLKSVTDNDTPVKVDEENGVYTISGITEDHKVKIETEKIPCTLKVYYVFSDGQKPATGFKDYEETLDYGSKYTAKVVEAPAGYTLTYDKEEVSGTITGNTEVWFLYTPNGQASVNVFYKIKDGYYLLPRRSTSDLIGRTYDVSSWKLDSITTPGGKIYDLENKDEVMKGTYKLGGTNITLLYTERTKAPITIEYESEDTTKAILTKDDYKTEGYTKVVYDIRGNAYIPETLTDGTGRTWYYSHNLPTTDLTGILEGPVTVTAKYYLKPTYSVTATYTTVSNGSSSVQTDATGKLTGEIGDTPFDLNTYVVKYGFTSSDYQNDLAVNGNPASEMPAMEKFGDYVVTLSYKKTVNSGVETTIKHDFRTFLDGVEIADNTTADDNVFSHTWGETVDMSKYSKAGQAGYEGYTVEKYSTPDGKLTAGDIGTITYVRNLVSVVFDLNGGTWNKSLNNVEYNVAKGTGLNSQQPVPQPEKDKCKFAGWTAQPSNATINGTFDQRTVFTAKWEQESVVTKSYFYTVTYNYTVTTDGTVTYQDSETTQVQDTTKASQTINASATASHGGYTFDLASPAEQTADLTGTTREAPHQFVVNYVLTVNNNGGGGRDDRDDDRPAPKPTPDTEIKDDDVPKTDLPEQPVEIPDEDTPKADLPQAPVDIPDEDTPKADVPKTGDAMGLWVMAAAASGAGLIWLNLTGKKRKDDNG